MRRTTLAFVSALALTSTAAWGRERAPRERPRARVVRALSNARMAFHNAGLKTHFRNLS